MSSKMTAIEFVQRYIFPMILIGYGIFVLVDEWYMSSSRWAGFIAIGLGIILAVIGMNLERKDKVEREENGG